MKSPFQLTILEVHVQDWVFPQFGLSEATDGNMGVSVEEALHDEPGSRESNWVQLILLQPILSQEPFSKATLSVSALRTSY